MRSPRLTKVLLIGGAGLALAVLLARVRSLPMASPEPSEVAVSIVVSSQTEADAPKSAHLSSDDIYWTVARALIRTVAYTEVGWMPGNGDRAYRTMYGGGTFDSFARHPEMVICAGAWCSSAAGGLQFMPDTWEGLKARYSDWYQGEEFSPPNQDLAFLRLYAEIGSWQRLISGIEVRGQTITVKPEAIAASVSHAAPVWCGLPGDYRGECSGQPQKTMPEVQEIFKRELAAEQEATP